mgnify:CR=1 FL=1
MGHGIVLQLFASMPGGLIGGGRTGIAEDRVLSTFYVPADVGVSLAGGSTHIHTDVRSRPPRTTNWSPGRKVTMDGKGWNITDQQEDAPGAGLFS